MFEEVHFGNSSKLRSAELSGGNVGFLILEAQVFMLVAKSMKEKSKNTKQEKV